MISQVCHLISAKFVIELPILGRFELQFDEINHHQAETMLDSFDRTILSIVQENNQRTHADIGEAVGLSASSVRRRLARMRKEGIIRADVSIVDPVKTMIQAIVLLNFKTESVEIYQDFKAQMLKEPAVTQCYAVAGEIDFVLVVQTDDLASYEAWGERVLMSHPAIGRYNTHIVWSRVKFSTALPLESTRES